MVLSSGAREEGHRGRWMKEVGQGRLMTVLLRRKM